MESQTFTINRFPGFRKLLSAVFTLVFFLAVSSSPVFAAEAVMPAPQDTLSVKLKWNDPPAKVQLKDWRCTGDGPNLDFDGTLMDEVKSVIGSIAGLDQSFPNDPEGMKNEALKEIDKDYPNHGWAISFPSLTVGPYDAPHGQTRTYKIKTCYTKSEIRQYIDFQKKLLEQLKNSNDPVGDAKRMLAQL